MQSALRSAARRAVGISSRRGVTIATKAVAATPNASEPRKGWVDEEAWVAAMVQREVRAQMAAEEQRRKLERLRDAAEDRLRRLEDEAALWSCGLCCSMVKGWVAGTGLGLGIVMATLLFGR